MTLFIWLTLVVIGVSDAKAHRIPNKLLLLLLVLLCVCVFLSAPQVTWWLAFGDKSAAFGLAFVFGLAMYLLKVMAPGDVKLIAVLGFFLGTGELVNYLFYVCLSTAFVGPMYWLMNRLQLALNSGHSGGNISQLSLTGMVVSMQLGKQELKKKITTGKDLTYIPFAPILIIGLALQQYFLKVLGS